MPQPQPPVTLVPVTVGAGERAEAVAEPAERLAPVTAAAVGVGVAELSESGLRRRAEARLPRGDVLGRGDVGVVVVIFVVEGAGRVGIEGVEAGGEEEEKGRKVFGSEKKMTTTLAPLSSSLSLSPLLVATAAAAVALVIRVADGGLSGLPGRRRSS